MRLRTRTRLLLKLQSALALALLVSCGSSTPAPQTPLPAQVSDAAEAQEDWVVDTSRQGMILESPSGTRVEVAPIVSPSNPDLVRHFVLRAQGTESEFDGAVVIVQRKRNNNHQFYIAQLRGEPIWLLQYFPQVKGWEYSGYTKTSMHGEKVSVVEEAVNGEALLALRKKQRGSKLASVETRDRAAAEKWQQREFDEVIQSLPGACKSLRAKIDWSSVPDEAFTTYSVVKSCTAPLYSLREFCNLHPLHQERVRDELEVTCRIDQNPDSSESEWSIATEADGHVVYTAGQGTKRWEVLLDTWRSRFDAHRTLYRAGDLYVLLDLSQKKSTVLYGKDGVLSPGAVSTMTNPGEFSLPSGRVRGYIVRAENDWELACGRERTHLERLPNEERDSILSSWKIESEPRWKREPYFLARDTRGNYYYVDRYREEFGGKRYRVFVGRRGQAKLTKLKGLVEDSEGTVFSTESGDLRLVVNSGSRTAVWIKGNRELPLTLVKVAKNRQLIFDELGVYYGDQLGFACE